MDASSAWSASEIVMTSSFEQESSERFWPNAVTPDGCFRLNVAARA